jgi:signal transduction histidine kinase/CheY-like chemotaxis protein
MSLENKPKVSKLFPDESNPSTSVQDSSESLRKRLSILNEINQLVISGVNLQRTTKTVARTAAFQLNADAVIILIKTSNHEPLEVKAHFGIAATQLPASLRVDSPILNKVAQHGGSMSVPDLNSYPEHKLDFLLEHRISAIHCCCIEVPDQLLGVILCGYHDAKNMDNYYLALAEEFSQAAAGAIAHAQSQERLNSYTEQLEDLVRARTHELTVQTDRAEQASKAKSRFVANMSHELRTPLTAVVAYSSVLQDGIFGPINQRQKEALDSIARAAQHLKELIDDVLDISKVEAGKTEPHPKEIDVNQLIPQIFKLMYQTAVGKGVKLVPFKEQTNISLKAFADPRQIRQALINLVSNAIKYTRAEGTVEFYVERVADKIKISVKDSGVGIDENEIDKLFGDYQRLGEDYSRNQVGTGLGLALTKQLVELNGGKVGVESQKGEGSIFWIMIPALSEKDQAVTNQAPISEDQKDRLSLSGLTVLIVDDNLSSCEVLQAILSEVGAKTLIADSVMQGKEMLENNNVDVALVDLAMPGENGSNLIRYIRKSKNKYTRNIPLLAISACVFEADQKEALVAGASAFFAKPFEPYELISAIRDLTTKSLISESS